MYGPHVALFVWQISNKPPMLCIKYVYYFFIKTWMNLPLTKSYDLLCVAFPGGILAVNYLDAAQEDFGISYQFMNVTSGMINNTIQYRSIQGSVNWLRSKT